MWSGLRKESKIVLSTLQIFAQLSTMLAMPDLLSAFLAQLKFTQLDVFAIFGMSCASRAAARGGGRRAVPVLA